MLDTQESELLSAFIDGELNGSELARVQTCLNESAEWREALERLKGAKSLSFGLPRLSAPADLLDAIEAQVRHRTEPAGMVGWFRSPWSYAGSLAAAAAVVLLVGRQVFIGPRQIPLDTLLAAHTHSANATLLEDNLSSASDYSSLIKTHANH